MSECSVDLVIDCEGRKSITKRLPITIKHDSQPFIGADISNEFSGVSWNTQTQAYIGLPITFDFTMWHNDEFLNIENANNVSLSTSTSGVTLVNGAAPATPAASSIYYTKTIETIVKNQGTVNQYSYKVARITITAMGADVPLVTDISVTASAIYSGVTYERTLVHTINKSTDTNVYSLLPSASEIVLDKNTNSLNISTLTCSVICDSSDDKHYTVAYADFATHGIIMYYKKFYTNGTSDADETLYDNTAISVGATVAEVRFYLYGRNGNNPNRNIVHDQEGVSVVSSGEDGDDAANYYLTSDINTIIKDYTGAFKGSARPTITAWKKVGDNEAVRLADIVNGNVVAEGMTINAYEMNGNTVAFTNTSTTGVLTVATPYSYVDRFEVELVKNSKTYATMSIPILKEVQGEQGDGVYPRDRGIFVSGSSYSYTKQGDIYIRDMVRYEIGGIMYGFLVKDKGTTVTAAPTSASGDSNWESAGIVQTVIANTIFGTNANIGGFMASSDKLRSSSILYKIRYRGTYQNNTWYYYSTAESQSDNIALRDMVKYNNQYYVILHQGSWTNSSNQTVSGNYVPAASTYYAPTNTEYWRKATQKEIQAVTYDDNGNEQTGGTLEIPMFELNGSNGTMRLTQQEETSWSVNEDGVQIVGMENGQRVEITPLEKKINIFDSSNKQVAQFDGDKVSTIDDLFGNSSGSLGGTDGFSGNHAETSPYSNWHSGYKEGFIELGAFGSFSGQITVVVNGTLRAQGSQHYNSSYYDGDPAAILIGGVPSPVQQGNTYLFKNHVIVQLVVGYYSNGSFKVQTILAETSALGVYETKNVNVSKMVYGNSNTTYYLAIHYKIGLYYSNQNWGNVEWSAIKLSYAGGSYISRVFANGFVYGLNGANFMSAVAETINGSTHMHVKAMSGNGMFGFEVSKDGLYVWISGTKYKVTVSGTNAVLTAQ